MVQKLHFRVVTSPPDWLSHEQGVSDSSVELNMTFNLFTVRQPPADRELVLF